MPKFFYLWKRSLWIKLFASVLMIVLLWITSSYLLLNSAWLPKQLSELQGIELSWDKGRSLHPGRWEIEGFYLAREDDELFFSIDAEKAILEISLYRLLWGDLYIHSLEAQGIRRLTLNDFILEGSGKVGLNETSLTSELLEVTQLLVQIDKGQITRTVDDSLLLRDIELYTDLRLDKVSPMDLNMEVLDALSGNIALEAYADAWDVFMPYLERLPWLKLMGHGRLEAMMVLSQGSLDVNSRVELNSPELQLEVNPLLLERQEISKSEDVEKISVVHRATGSGRVILQVDETERHSLLFSIALENVELADDTPYAMGADLLLKSRLANRRVDRLDIPASTQLTVNAQVIRLDMLDMPLAELFEKQGMKVRGSGDLNINLTYLGQVLDHGELTVNASNLQVKTFDFDASGNGMLKLHVDSDQFSSDLQLRSANLLHESRTLLDNAQLRVVASGPLDFEEALDSVSADIHWQSATLPDISVLQPYLDPYFENPLRLLSGRASSEGRLTLAEKKIRGNLSLEVDHLRTEIKDQIVQSDASLFLNLHEASLDGRQLNISGSRLSWSALADSDKDNALASQLTINRALFFRRNDQPAGQFSIQGRVQQLSFLNAFLPKAHGLAIQGHGSLYVTGQFQGSRLLGDSYLGIAAEQLEVNFLDYIAYGYGQLNVSLESAEIAFLSLNIPEYRLQRVNDENAHLQGRNLVITTQTDHFSKVMEAPEPKYFITRISMPNTEIPDFTRYNHYLPEGAGITLLGGQARLSSEFELESLQASGKVNLTASSISMELLKQQIRGDLHLSLLLEEGDLVSRQFLASHSSLRLDNVQREFSGDVDWWVELTFDEAQLRWTDHIDLESHLTLTMRDTGLLARLFLESAREREWLGRMLDVKNLKGTANLQIDINQIRLREIDLRGYDLMVLADLTLKDSLANGALYARKGLPAVGVELINGETTVRFLRPRLWFDEWRLGQ